MTDFEYDCYQKKIVARSAAHRKRGSKSKKCNLPSDYMTEKQWNERCGEIMSYQIGKPMIWAEFCKLPNDLKEEYMNGLIDKYSANAKGMADMFGVSVATVFRMVKKENLDVKFLKGRYPSGEKEEAFKKFLSGDTDECCDSVACDVISECDDRLPVPEQDVDGSKFTKNDTLDTRLDSFSMNFSGEVNIDMIANSLRYILGSGKRARVQITCEIE